MHQQVQHICKQIHMRQNEARGKKNNRGLNSINLTQGKIPINFSSVARVRTPTLEPLLELNNQPRTKSVSTSVPLHPRNMSKLFPFISCFSIPCDAASTSCPPAPAVGAVTKGLSPASKPQPPGLVLTPKPDGSQEDWQRTVDLGQLLHVTQDEIVALLASGCQRC